MTKFDDGGPAFPHPDEGRYLNPEKGTGWVPQTGMTLWDYYAAAALQGIASNPTNFPYEKDAESARLFADAMLAERRKQFQGEQE